MRWQLKVKTKVVGSYKYIDTAKGVLHELRLLGRDGYIHRADDEK